MNNFRKKIVVAVTLLLIWIAAYLNLKPFSDWFMFDLLSFEEGIHLTDALWFFTYEVPKVFLLLILIIFIVGFIRSYFSPERTRKLLEGQSLLTGNVLAALLGIVTPFCSCSAIPLFLGFVEAGIPIGVTFSFLISAPMVNEVALVLLVGLFGWKIAVIYVATGLIIAIISGFVIEKLNLQKYVADWVFTSGIKQANIEDEKLTFSDRLNQGYSQVKEIVSKIWLYIILGIAIGAGAHGYVPENFMAQLLGSESWYGVLLAIIIGVPMYSNAAGIIPVVSVLIEKGVSIGTALAFMMSVIGLSLPEIIILKKVLKWQLIAVFVGVVSFGIIVVGYLINWLM